MVQKEIMDIGITEKQGLTFTIISRFKSINEGF